MSSGDSLPSVVGHSVAILLLHILACQRSFPLFPPHFLPHAQPPLLVEWAAPTRPPFLALLQQEMFSKQILSRNLNRLHAQPLIPCLPQHFPEIDHVNLAIAISGVDRGNLDVLSHHSPQLLISPVKTASGFLLRLVTFRSLQRRP
jgi:hypothetical protein